MAIANAQSGLVADYASAGPDPRPAAGNGLSGLAASGPAAQLVTSLSESLSRVAAVAAISLSTPRASVMVASTRSLPAMSRPSGFAGQQSTFEQSMCATVIGSGQKLVIDNVRVAGVTVSSDSAGPVGTTAWAGLPVHDQNGHVAGVIWAADRGPRQWTARDVALLETLATIASGEMALRAALAHSSRRAALAQTLEESLRPPRLPQVPDLQVAARYAAGGKGTEVLGDFWDVFPSVGRTWGMVVGDVCGSGPVAAKNTALARHTLRAAARRRTRPALILADLNQALLDWPTDDPRFLTAIYASVRPLAGGAMVRISSAGHPLALVRSAHGHVQEFGRPGTLLGVLPDPELHDTQRLLRAGDSLILFSDGVTEARSGADRELFGEERLRHLIDGLGDLTAAAMAEAIQLAALVFTGGCLSDDTVTLVLKVPPEIPRG